MQSGRKTVEKKYPSQIILKIQGKGTSYKPYRGISKQALSEKKMECKTD